MLLKKDKNYPKMISFLLSAENSEHALNPILMPALYRMASIYVCGTRF
jgi:hypothetical protein